MKLAIVGSRDFPDLPSVERFIDGLDETYTIITGGARGVDSVAEKAALKRGLKVEVFKPDYVRFTGKVAPLERNTRIAHECDALVAFWDGKSNGTIDVCVKAKNKGKSVQIAYPESVEATARLEKLGLVDAKPAGGGEAGDI